MDERIMQIVSLITGQVQTKQDLFHNEGKIMDSLVSSGYRLHEADAALTLLQNLSQDSGAGAAAGPLSSLGGMRTMTAKERNRFTIEAFSFISKLAQLGIISEDLREDLLGKALSLHPGKIELDQVRSLLAIDLLAGGQDQEEYPGEEPAGRGTVWN